MIEAALDNLKESIIKNIKAKVLNDWYKCKLVFEFPPYINRGSTGSQFFEDKDGNKADNVIFLDDEGLNIFFSLIVKYNQEKEYNTIIFETKKDDYENALISISFSQETDDKFRSLLPKSWKKKTWLPWWKNPEETKGLV
jgi:hypothetical protein